MDVVRHDVEQGEISSLRTTSKPPPLVVADALPPRVRMVALRLEPCWQDLGLQLDLCCNIEDELHDPRLGIQAQADGVGSCDAAEEMGQAGREGGILDKRLLLALDESSEEQDGLLDDPLIARSRGNLADGDVYLSEGGKLDARMGQRAAALVAEDVCELLEADLEVLGGV